MVKYKISDRAKKLDVLKESTLHDNINSVFMLEEKKQEVSRFKFLWIDITFTKEERWEKILWIFLALLTFLGLVLILNHFAAPAIALERVTRIKLGVIMTFLKSRSP